MQHVPWLKADWECLEGSDPGGPQRLHLEHVFLRLLGPCFGCRRDIQGHNSEAVRQ